MSMHKFALMTLLTLAPVHFAQANGAISGGTDNPLTPAVPFILKEIKSPLGGGHCMITPVRIWITNTDGNDAEDSGLKLFLGKTLIEKIRESSEEIVYRGVKRPGERVYAFDGVKNILLMDGDLGQARSGPATSWLMNTVAGLCNSLR